MDSLADPVRRRFLASGAAIGGGLVIAFAAPLARGFAPGAGSDEEGVFRPNAFLSIGSDDSITVLVAHSEMGQGVWTTLSMLIAEELDADWSKIRVEHAPAAPEYANLAFGIQMTGGSTSTWSEFDRYRKAGAAARELLIQAAAMRFNTPVDRIRTGNGEVIVGSRRIRFGALADDAARLPLQDSASLRLSDPGDWKLIGKSMRRLDTPEKITGRARYGMDVQFPGLLTAVVERAPVFGATVKSFDPTAARAIHGVRDVVQIPSGVAVVADHYWAAKCGRDVLRVEWDSGEGITLDSDRVRGELARLAETTGAIATQAGDADAAMERSARTIDATYSVPYLAHAPMEPLNCTVRISPDLCEIWTGTQAPGLDQKLVAQITGLPLDRVRVHTMFLGGGFGRRKTPTSDFVIEAVHVALAARAPVKTVWSREDDIRGGYYRPAYVHRARIGLDAMGLPVAWLHCIAGQSILAGTRMIRNGIDAKSVEGVADSPYLASVPHHRVDLHSPKSLVPVLFWRSVGHSHAAFVMESLIDELAHAAGQDPIAYRRRMLANHPRHLGVLGLAADKAGWGAPPKPGRALGLAVHESFGSYVAQVAEVSIDQAQDRKPAIRVHRVVCAVDCGVAINPDGIRAQIESGVVFGLSAALFGKLTIREGRVQESNFHDYPVLRISEMPQVEVHVTASEEKPGGIGEVGVPPIAPAIANAVFALTGRRLRELPLKLG